MAKLPNRASEDRVARGVLKIAASRGDGLATFRRIRAELPDVVKLTDADKRISDTRPNEPMWHQIVRNIKCHDSVPGNIIHDGLAISVPKVGYRITDTGRKRV
jgi:hypothetical protein